MPKSSNVTTVSRSDENRVAATLTLAFCVDPITRWAFGDALQHLTIFTPFTGLFGGRAFDRGSAYIINDFAGAALWLPPSVHPDEEGLVALFEQHIPQPRLGEMFALFQQMASYHPEEPHWYLPLIGVDPAFQGRGLGGELMRHALKVCDAESGIAYLESTNPANISLYERHGFRVLGEIRVTEGAPPMYPMRREAQ